MMRQTVRTAVEHALLAVVLLSGAVTAGPGALLAQDAGPFDLLIVNGRVMDGTGNPWFDADIGVRGGRIVAVGQLAGARANRVVDAKGLYVAPGFIDIHSHADDGSARIGGATIRSDDPKRKAAPNDHRRCRTRTSGGPAPRDRLGRTILRLNSRSTPWTSPTWPAW